MEYECKTHGVWDANKASGCPECVHEMRKEIATYRGLLECVVDKRIDDDWLKNVRKALKAYRYHKPHGRVVAV